MIGGIFNIFVVLIATALFSVHAFAGAPTTSIVINGPKIPPQGIVLTGSWPGGAHFIDLKNGPVPEPASTLPRYVLAGAAEGNSWWYTVLYVWDGRSNRALVYLPGPFELGYRINYGPDMSYEKRAGKWYAVSDQEWALMIRKALP